MSPSSLLEVQTMPLDETVMEQAVGWSVRTGNPGFDDWEGFTAWLGESPAHGEAYDAVCAAVAEAAELAAITPSEATDDPVVVPLFRRPWFGAAIAASLLVAVVGSLGLWRSLDTRYTLETAPGAMQVAALGDGGRVELSGGTRLELDRSDLRYARLLAGQAVFHVRHDAADPFEVLVGDDRLVDAGTVFDVRMGADGMQVAVAEGLVVFNPQAQKVEVAPGHVLRRAAGSSTYTLAAIAPAQVGEWREGRLTFDDASLADVAADLSRLTGIDYRAAPSGGRLSGSILVAPLRKDPGAVASLLGVAVRRDSDGWVIAAD